MTIDRFTYYPAVGERPAYAVRIDEDGDVFACMLSNGDGVFPKYGEDVPVGNVLTQSTADARDAAMRLVDLYDSALAGT
jgi:hypothetical protein